MKLLDYLRKESNNEHTEFRIVAHPDGKCYIHVLGRDSETLEFYSVPENPPQPPPVKP